MDSFAQWTSGVSQAATYFAKKEKYIYTLPSLSAKEEKKKQNMLNYISQLTTFSRPSHPTPLILCSAIPSSLAPV
jgi:hypothetical protein